MPYSVRVGRSDYICLAERRKSAIKSRLTSEKRNSERIDTRRSSARLLIIGGILICLCLCLASAFGESLWTPDFKGYLEDGTEVDAGDIITVVIDADFSLTFTAASNDSKSITFEFSGGEFGDVLAFLPRIETQGNRRSRAVEEHTLRSSLAARIIEIDPSGLLYVQGRRVFAIEGKEESIAVSGWVDSKDLNSSREVSFARLADSKVVFQSFLQPSAPVITDADLEQLVEELAAEMPAAEQEQGGTEGTAADTTPAVAASTVVESTGTTPPGTTPPGEQGSSGSAYRLTQQKKKELFLIYVNRMVDLLFR